ncbi:hypothetical protein AW736_23930 [Termitidicoccus mucosus]|uniref:Restriction endonuclease type IV Mrr domain-containing protein n=1 Tax=Termitidicoccus mucosus TaxID=1184151 RepID=A0A178IDS4_9BACT|nr:hypothetical protein AW736_23930 [Opitutaceae bacterium TSB47]
MNSIPRSRPSTKQKRDVARIQRYLDLYDRVAATRDSDDPNWRARTLLWIIDIALHNLAAALRSGKRVKWRSPFWAFQYPVEWDWKKWRWNQSELAMRYGELSSRNTQTRKEAMRSLAQISTRESIYTTLQYFTNEVSTFKRGRYQHPMMPEPLAESVRSIRGRNAQVRALEKLFAPFSIGAAEIELPEGIKPRQRIPRKLAKQLAEQTSGMRHLICRLSINGHPVSVRIIFQAFPLTIDELQKRVYFPITIGIALTPDEPVDWNFARPPAWLDPAQWRASHRRKLWTTLSEFLRRGIDDLQPKQNNAVVREIAKTSATLQIEMEACSPDDVQQSASELLETLRQKGFLTKYQVQTAAPVAGSSKEALRRMLSAVENSEDSRAKGTALEKLLTALLKGVPGFEVQKGVRTLTEEIDVKVLNSNPDPRWRDTPIVLVECKNWSGVCGKNEVVLFQAKLENRRGRAKLGFLVSWNGFARTTAHELLRGSRGNTQIALLSAEHIRTAVEHGDILPSFREAVDRADAT